MIPRWQLNMTFFGEILKSARSCKKCKGTCVLWEHLHANRFTRNRRMPSWPLHTDRWYQPSKSVFVRRIEEIRIDRRMTKKYG
jgi:hypothetical protein